MPIGDLQDPLDLSFSPLIPMNLRVLGSLAALTVGFPNWVVAQPKVEELVLGPYDPSRTAPTFRKDGLHMGLTVPTGSKSVIMVDGVEGPRFESLIHRVVFSVDGARHAYVAIVGNEGILVLDGKDVARAPSRSTRRRSSS
jgi:hypothetical protein